MVGYQESPQTDTQSSVIPEGSNAKSNAVVDLTLSGEEDHEPVKHTQVRKSDQNTIKASACLLTSVLQLRDHILDERHGSKYI